MAVQAGLYTDYRIAPVTPNNILLTIPPTHRGNILIIKNSDAQNAIWFKWGTDAAVQAVVGQIGPGGSYRLAAGESVSLPGVSCLFISLTAEGGTPFFTVMTYAATGLAIGIGGS